MYMKLEKDKKYICLLAPSFAAEFDYPNIIYQLRMLGFDQVVELTFGAKMVNHAYYEILKESIKKGEKKTWISSPCPTLVNFIKVKYPHLIPNLVPVLSPMGAMSLICKKYYPEHIQIFVGPCISKKLEAKELGGILEAWTFKELEIILKEEGIPQEVTDSKYCISFDKFYNDYTKIYPISGGLSTTLHYTNILKEKDILVMEGLNDLMKILEKFENGMYKNYKFLDLLNCKGGCINGPGMIGTRSVKERTKRIMDYREYARRYEKDLGNAGTKMMVDHINLEKKF